MALPARRVRSLDQGLVPISPVVEERNVDPGPHCTARLVAHGSRSKGTASVDGRYRHPPNPRGLEWRCHLTTQGGPYGRTNGAKRIVWVDVTGLALCVRVVPASTSEASAVEQILDDLARTGADERLELVLVDRGTSKSAALRMSAKFNYEVRRVGWDEPPRNDQGAKIFRPIRHAWRVEVAHGHLVRRRRLARCFENTVTSSTRSLSPWWTGARFW